MNRFLATYTRFFQRFFPSPFSISIGLTLLSVVFVLFFTDYDHWYTYIPKLGLYWYEGLWTTKLLAFTVHMMLILVLGHALALSKPIQHLISFILRFCTSNSRAVFFVTLSTIVASLFNWGLGVIFGAIFARKIAEKASKNNIAINYPLIGACAYVGLMVWHGGLSGSAPLDVSDAGHNLVSSIGILPMNETIFSTSNTVLSLILLLLLPISMYFLSKKSGTLPHTIEIQTATNIQVKKDSSGFAESMEKSPFIGIVVGMCMLSVFVYIATQSIYNGSEFFTFLSLGTTNLLLLGLALVFHGSLHRFIKAIESAIKGTSGILIQFPLYFGIMGIMTSSGLADMLSNFFVSISTADSLPIYTFISAGIVNIFVPSGGGQWQIQGPIIMDAARSLNVPYSKMVMAFCYGDQLTNMLQPFWALPLLGITGLKAKDILPYTLILFGIGFFIFNFALLFIW